MIERALNREAIFKIMERGLRKGTIPGNDSVTWAHAWQNKESFAIIVKQRALNYKRKELIKTFILKRGDREDVGVVPDIEDRVIEMSICMVLENEKIWNYGKALMMELNGEKAFKHHADIYLRKYGDYVCSIDVENYYRSVDHSIFIKFLKKYISDGRMVDLIKNILDLKEGRSGIQIGHPLATYLMRKFLFSIDKELFNKPVLRFCDDFFFFSGNEEGCIDFIKSMREMLLEIGLKANEHKITINHRPSIKSLLKFF